MKRKSEHLSIIEQRKQKTYNQFLLFASDNVNDDDDDDDWDLSSCFSLVADWWLAFDPLATVKDVSRSSSSGLIKASSRPAIVINSPRLEIKKYWLFIYQFIYEIYRFDRRKSRNFWNFWNVFSTTAQKWSCCRCAKSFFAKI